MDTTYYRLCMENDFGQEDLIFSSPRQAKLWAETAYAHNPCEEPFEEYWADLCEVVPLVFIK